MDARMFLAVAEHERAVHAYVDSTFSGIPSQMDDDESAWIERPFLQQPIGSIVFSAPSINYPVALAGGCVDDTCNQLIIEQPMEFVTHDSALEVMREASQVEPIPYYRAGQHGMHHPAQPVQGGYWSNHATRQSISALAVDWDTLEFGEEEFGDSGGTEVVPSAQHPTPSSAQYRAMDQPEEVMYQV
jgi:hypothetical protein